MRLRAALALAPGAPRGSVVLSPGRTEPLEKYWEVVHDLHARGFSVLLHDWRGQGGSGRLTPDPMAGHAAGWRPFLDDYRRVLDAHAERLPRPWIAVGHSMGGGLTALALSEGQDRFAAAVLSAPMMGVQLGRLPVRAARLACRGLHLAGRAGAVVRRGVEDENQRFESNSLTHDPDRFERGMAQLRARPDLRLGSITWGWLDFALALQGRLARPGAAERVTIPLTVVAAAEEKLVLNPASQRFAERAPKGRWVEVPGAYHEIMMETDDKRAVFWTEFDCVADQVCPRA